MTNFDPQRLRGSEAFDAQGGKLGRVDNVFVDTATGRPEWAAVSSGFFGKKVSLVPLATATEVDGGLQVPFDKEMVKGAPHHDPDAELSPEDEAALFRYYGVPYGGETVTARGGPQASPGRAGGEAMTRSEEELVVGKAAEPVGRVRLRKWVETEPVEMVVPVAREEVRVEREPITEANVDAAMSGPELSEGVHEETLHEEHVEVAKRVVPKERVRLEKDTVVSEERVSADVSKERIEVEGPERRA